MSLKAREDTEPNQVLLLGLFKISVDPWLSLGGQLELDAGLRSSIGGVWLRWFSVVVLLRCKITLRHCSSAL